MKKIILLLFFFIQFSSFGQEINPRNDFKNGFGLKIGGPTFALALNYNHFIDQNLNFEVGVGFIGAYSGFKYYFGKEEKVMRFAPYVGMEFCYSAILFDGYYPGAYLPLGVQFFSKNGFNLSLEASCFLILGYGNTYGFMGGFGGVGAFPWGSLHIGKNF
jgi:hypothetical protein